MGMGEFGTAQAMAATMAAFVAADFTACLPFGRGADRCGPRAWFPAWFSQCPRRACRGPGKSAGHRSQDRGGTYTGFLMDC